MGEIFRVWARSAVHLPGIADTPETARGSADINGANVAVRHFGSSLTLLIIPPSNAYLQDAGSLTVLKCRQICI